MGYGRSWGQWALGHPIKDLTDSYFAFRRLSTFHSFSGFSSPENSGRTRLLGTGMSSFLKIALKLSADFLIAVEPLGSAFPQGISVE
jgi:hypothetical protein